jgi:DNA-binding response OmpR family regulator
MRPKALVVEDDPSTRHLLAAILEAEGADVDIAGDGERAIEMLSRGTYSVILLDLVLPRVSGTAVMEHLRVTKPAVLENVIVVTGLDVAEIRTLFPTVKQALSKPVLPMRLRAMVRSCVSDWGSTADAFVA